MITARMAVPTIPVTDLERAKQFYGETLGLELLWETPVAARFRSGSRSCTGAPQRGSSRRATTIRRSSTASLPAPLRARRD